jgi:hypothetical protein
MFNTVPTRFCDDAIDITDFNDIEQLHGIFNTYHMTLAMGYSCVGKTKSLEAAIEGYDSRPVIFWNREPILKMIYANRTVVHDSIHGVIEKAESDIINYQFARTTGSRLVLDGWYRMPSRRRNTHNYLGQYNSAIPTACLVFDGPQHLICERMRADIRYEHMIDSEIELEVAEKISSTQWPSKKEGWNRIIYVNTFGQEGIEYLQNTLRTQ